VLVATVALVAPAGASAATTIGQIDPGTPTSSCTGTSYWAQNATGAGVPSYSVPADGVITSWSHKAGVATGRELGLRIFRLVSGTTYQLVGSSGVQILTPNTVNTFSTRIPVKAGDRLGLYVGNAAPFPLPSGGAACASTGGVGDLIHEGLANPEPATGSSVSLGMSYTSIYRLNVTAKVEPDADGDGYGDETQDGCPTSAASIGSCPQPGTKDRTRPRGTVTGKRDSVRDRFVSVKVTPDEPVTAITTGTIAVPNSARVYKLKRLKSTLAKNVATKVKLLIPKKARRPIARALRRGRKLKAKLTIVLTDAAGNATTLKSSVSLRR
jgi:hypothetical protein